MPTPDPKLEKLLAQASAHRSEGRLRDSLVPLRRAARLAPRNETIQHDLGATLLLLDDPAAALAHFDRAIALRETFAAAHFRRARALETLNRPGAAEAYERAIAEGFETPEAFARLAALLQQSGRRAEAAPLYRHAASLAPNTLAALMSLARAALIDNDLAAAEPLLRQALTVPPGLHTARALLAYILRARGDFAAATAEIEQALRDHPAEIGLYDELLQSHPPGQHGAALIARMRAAPATAAPASQRLRLHLALARALDAHGDHPAAEQELGQADALRAAQNPFDPATLIAEADAIERLFTPAYMANPRHEGSPSTLPILVVGLPRSGTTLVEQILASHPLVAGAGEVHFWEAQGRTFLPHAAPDQPAGLRQVAEAYLATLQRAAPGAAHVVDKMPFNFRWAPLIHLALPHAKIIHLNRHPADTALSILSTNMATTHAFSPVRADLLLYMRLHQRLMAHITALLPPATLLNLSYEHLVTAPEPTIRALLAHCGLPFHPACLTPEKTQRTVLTFSQHQARQPITPGAIGRWKNHAGWLADFVALEEREGLLF